MLTQPGPPQPTLLGLAFGSELFVEASWTTPLLRRFVFPEPSFDKPGIKSDDLPFHPTCLQPSVHNIARSINSLVHTSCANPFCVPLPDCRLLRGPDFALFPSYNPDRDRPADSPSRRLDGL